MSSIEREIFDRVSHLNSEAQERILAFVRSIEEAEKTEPAYSVRDLMKLPFEERNRLVIQALEQSAERDNELFDVYDDRDFDDQ